ncbi:hypothetical protein HNQ38_002815 [Desulfovibrio intestinalis]|uniref:Uncharacterized protein n=1 Tax=Desulfovibrio intestinalis TaxID=58621 RepID=A0A7W8C324_9BACT|nr:hypothetical protein [Desulfovibrio intestinalis]
MAAALTRNDLSSKKPGVQGADRGAPLNMQSMGAADIIPIL